jgi:hypothetical protein
LRQFFYDFAGGEYPMKKIFFTVLIFVILAFAINAQKTTTPKEDVAAVEQKGDIAFKAFKIKDSYSMTLSLSQVKPVTIPVKAVKVTFEPSHTVVFLLCDCSLAQSGRLAFLGGQKPVVKMEMAELDPRGFKKAGSSLVEPVARTQTAFPRQTAKDNIVKFEMLVEKKGKLEPQTVFTAVMPDSADFETRSSYSIK